MNRILVAVLLLALTSPVFAQSPDPEFLQRVLETVAIQRNNALNASAIAEAKAAVAEDRLAKAQARIKELETKAEPKN